MLGHPVSNSIFGLPGNATFPRLRCGSEPSYRRQRHKHGRREQDRVIFRHHHQPPPPLPSPPLRGFSASSVLFISLTSLVTILVLTLLYAAPSLTTRMSYGGGFNATGNNHQLSISRPTIELGLDGVVFYAEPSAEPCSPALKVSRLDFYSLWPGSEWNK
jgi:hypothetical protein